MGGGGSVEPRNHHERLRHVRRSAGQLRYLAARDEGGPQYKRRQRPDRTQLLARASDSGQSPRAFFCIRQEDHL
eukprot:COSAG05_NODE_1199_length_5553_cov_4.400990_6_plen_74_part_00